MFNDPRFIYLHTGILHTNNLSVKNIVPKAEVDVVHISSGTPFLRIDGAVLFIRYVVSSLKVISTDTCPGVAITCFLRAPWLANSNVREFILSSKRLIGKIYGKVEFRVT